MLSPWALEPGNPETYPIYMANNTMPSLVTKSVSRDSAKPGQVEGENKVALLSSTTCH